MIEVNKYQTILSDELLNSLHPEVKEQLLIYINAVPFIQNLISPDRKYAKDLNRDDKNRIIVDVCNPHILEDMEYFRPTGNHYKKHGCFTKLRPNNNPNSEFGKWFKEELNRCWNGYVRESDGEWVTGDFYFYINYCPIKLTKERESSNGSKSADRVTDFPEIWEANYLWFHYLEQARYGGLYDEKGGNQAALIARRGIGKSFTAGALLAKLFIVGLNYTVNKEVMGLVTAYEKEYLTKDGTLNKFLSYVDFLTENAYFPSSKYKNSFQEMTWTMGYLDAELEIVKGTKNTILGVSSKDNSDKMRGKRCHTLIFEEFGRFPKFIDTWNTTLYNVTDGEYVFGQMVCIGTGGTEGNDFSGAVELIYNPKGYHVYGVPNLFDKNSQGKTSSVYFLGMYMNRKGFYNKDGVSDVIGSLISELGERISIKYNSSDPTTLQRRIAEMPITIQDAIMRKDGTIYPVAMITDRLNEIAQTPNYLGKMWIGGLSISNTGNVSYKPSEAEFITNFPHKDNKLIGAMLFKAMPEKDSTGHIPWGRYIAGNDTFDDDQSDTLSLGSLFILDLFTDDIVFEYTGRPGYADEFYENCRRALIFYNAECNYENNKKGLFGYFSRMNSLYLLSDTLEFLRDKQIVKADVGYGNKSKGTQSTEPVKKYARRCIRDWLLKPIETISINAEGEEVVSTIYTLQRLVNKALLEELAGWTPEGNYDRHDALGMLMLLREDKLRVLGSSSPQDRLNSSNTQYAGNDDFFNKNYKERPKYS